MFESFNNNCSMYNNGCVYRTLAERSYAQIDQETWSLSYDKKDNKLTQVALDILKNCSKQEAQELATVEKMNFFVRLIFVHFRGIYLFCVKPAKIGKKIIAELTGIHTKNQRETTSSALKTDSPVKIDSNIKPSRMELTHTRHVGITRRDDTSKEIFLIGAEIQIEYKEKERIIQDEGTVLMNFGTIFYFKNRRGEEICLDMNDVSLEKIVLTEESIKVSCNILKISEEDIKNITEYQDQTVCIQPRDGTKRPLFGKLLYDEDDADLIRIKQVDGIVHQIDSEHLLGSRLFVFEDSPQLPLRLSRMQTPQAISRLHPLRREKKELLKQLQQDLRRQIHPLENPLLYDFFLRNPDELDQILDEEYAQEETEKIQSLPEAWQSICRTLLLDPGIHENLDAFLSFCRNRDDLDTPPSPTDIREQFSQQLGTATLYRSMWLDKSQLDHILKNGIDSPQKFFSEDGGITELENLFFRPSKTFSYQSWAQTNLSGEDLHYSAISFSQEKAVALSVGYHAACNKKVQQKKRDFYLFSTQVPKIFVISQNKEDELFDSEGKFFQVGEKRFEALSIENFVFIHCKKEWLTSYEKISKVPPENKTAYSDVPVQIPPPSSGASEKIKS